MNIKKSIIRLCQWLIAISLIGLTAYLVGDIQQLANFTDLKWSFIVLVALSTFLFTVVHGVRWVEMVKGVSPELHIEKWFFFRLYRWLINSYALGLFLPTDIALLGLRTLYMHRSGTQEASVALFAVLMDRIFDLLIFIVFMLPTLLFVIGMSSERTIVLVLLVILVLLVASLLYNTKKSVTVIFTIYNYVISVCSRIPFLNKYSKIHQIDGTFIHSLKRPLLLKILVLTIGKYALLTVRFWFIGIAIGIHMTFLQGLFLVPFVQIAALVNITPGGLGVVEMSSYGALSLIGVPDSKILLFLLVQRVVISLTFVGLACIANMRNLFKLHSAE
jgi:uncharacterized protein (TIRG00374 family)